MPEKNSYNPNSVWTSKAKKYTYEPSSSPAAPEKKPPALEPEATPDGSSGMGKKIAMVGGGIVLLALIGLAVRFLVQPATVASVGISFTKPDQVFVGDPFPVTISYTNTSAKALADATLSLTLPDGVSFAGEPPDQRVMQWNAPSVDADGTESQTSTLIVTGNPNSVQHISALLTYNPDSSGSGQFQASASADIVVGLPAVGLTITAPTDISTGQNFTVAVAYVNSTGHGLGDVKIDMQYPGNFNFVGSSVSPDSPQNNEWDLGALATGANGNFTITGNMVGQDSASYSVSGVVNIDLLGQEYSVASQVANFAIAPSPLKLTMTLNGQQNYVAGLGDELDYTITYVNDSPVTLQNAVITASFVGSMFDFSTLRSAGSFNSINNVLTWSPGNTPALLQINPGQSGSVTLSVNTQTAFPIRLLSDKNYVVKVHAQISSPTVAAGTAASSTVSVADLTNKVGGHVTFAAAGYWHDTASAGIAANTGPYPPYVDQPTEYTVHWDIANYSTDIANVTVSAYLQSGTTCTGQFASNIPGSLPNCNSATGEVTWTIPAIAATTGVISPPAEAVFQVTNTPAINQVGQDIVLVGPSSLSAMDEFTSSTIRLTAPPVDTSLPEDKSVVNGGRGVQDQ